MKPLLQLVHVSDVHVVSDAERFTAWLEWVAKYEQDGGWLAERFAEGLAAHDEGALLAFEEFCEQELREPPWDEVPAWLLSTGDATTWGDPASLDRAQELVQTVSPVFDQVVAMHGNHDAWPGEFPLYCSDAQIEATRSQLRGVWFTYTCPSEPVRCHEHGPDLDVQLFTLNTVLHDRWPNTLARGYVAEDRYWEGGKARATPGVQLQRLASLASAAAPADGRRVLRLLATHHPIGVDRAQRVDIHPNLRSKNPVKRRSMALRNSDELSRPLGLSTDDPLVHLVLSGHTHRLYPPLGKVLRTQLVVGSMAQLDASRARFAVNEIQILRIAVTEDDKFRIARHVATRSGGNPAAHVGTGAFEWVRAPGGSLHADTVEV